MSFGKFASLFFISGILTLPAYAGAKISKDDPVWITRPDGSLQCDEKTKGSGPDPILAAKTQLTENGIHIIEAKKRNDGRMRAQMCGISTGNETSFLIPKNELEKAKSLGFDSVR